MLGPDSLTWRHLGDARNLFVAQRAGVLQAMHPAIAAGLIDHSDVFEDPFGRLARSAGPILGVIFDPDPEATARWIRDQHPAIRGVDHRGRRYHALDPETYHWAHATFFEAQIAAQKLFGEPLGETDLRALYEESVAWYSRYGLTLRPVPADYEAFTAYWAHMLENELEATAPARAAVRTRMRLPLPAHPLLRRPLRSAAEPTAGMLGAWLTRATLPARARETLGVGWGTRDAAAFTALRHTVRAVWPLLPPRLSRLPRARAADRREADPNVSLS